MEVTYWYFIGEVIETSSGKMLSRHKLLIKSDNKFFPVGRAEAMCRDNANPAYDKRKLLVFIINQVEMDEVIYKASGGK